MRKIEARGVAVAVALSLGRCVALALGRRVANTTGRRVALTLARRALHKIQHIMTTNIGVVKLQHTNKFKFAFSTMAGKRMIRNYTA